MMVSALLSDGNIRGHGWMKTKGKYHLQMRELPLNITRPKTARDVHFKYKCYNQGED